MQRRTKNKMTKTFKIVKGNLQVTVDASDTVFIPNGDKREEVGSFTQKTVQTIKKDKIKILKSFIVNEKTNARKQIKQLEEQYDKVKDLQDIDDKLMKHATDAIQKGSKAFKLQMQALNKRIIDLTNKKQMKLQLDYLKKQSKEVNSDLKALNTVLK